ncbi:MAG TPA: TIGR03435 family protein [Acidobacteriaceae bacterium]|nr:TIGR03435 family protein [Acidobacteriaceae bacterium]
MIRKVCMACVLSVGFSASSQMAVAPTASFEVASIRRDATTNAGSYIRYLPGGRLSASSWIKQVIQLAYGMKDYQVMGGPGWLGSDWYTIEAKAEDPSATKDQIIRMMQAMLVDRFKFKMHTELKNFDVYYLEVDKGGARLSPLKEGEASKCGRNNSYMCGITSPGDLAGSLKYIVGRPVFDKTGIAGRYDVLLDFDTYSAMGRTAPEGYEKPSLQAALHDQLGLKLEPHKEPMPVLVVDSIERPTEN